ncbi:MAG: hypothetical protein ACK4WC_00290 [Rubrimonas sp.]|jgi:cytochrome c553
MSEAWMMELLTVLRDGARRSGMYRLAEHLDDAALLAVSEFHDRIEASEAADFIASRLAR